jgi:putative hydrolase of the HAD superfamily
MASTDNTISIVLFDFGGVIAEEGFKAGLAAIARANGLDAPSFIQKAFEAIHSSGYVFGKASKRPSGATKAPDRRRHAIPEG